MTTTTPRSTTHDGFVLERTYPASAARIFAAFATLEAKRQWFNGPDDCEPEEYSLDFRVGGREYLKIAMPDGGPVFTYDSVFQDIIEDERIIHTYEMQMDGARISVSVATVELTSSSSGTTLTLTEAGVYLDGLDTNEQRRGGTEEFLDSIAKYLEANA
jgi:uncharacterized protein YndB with AHSA1/START domain